MMWLRQLLFRRRLYSELSAEIQEHLEERIDELVANGTSREEAVFAARREFGNVALIEERSREVWGWAWLDNLTADVAFAIRQIRRNPGLAFAVCLSLALGIGATTVIFSVVYAVLINPYPYEGADRMVHVHVFDKTAFLTDLLLSSSQFRQFQNDRVLDGAIAMDQASMADTGGDLPESVTAGHLSSNAFDYFGAPALMGREFSPEDARDALHPANVAVLSYQYWQRHYAGQSDVLGKTLQLNRENYTVIGVLPKRFAWWGCDVYTPLKYSPDPDRTAMVFVRIKPNIGLSVAQAELQASIQEFAKETPRHFPHDFKIGLVPLNDIFVGSFTGTIYVIFGAVTLLLVIGCANASILLLARGVTRTHELAVRAALGASRRRIVGQLLTESITLSLTSGLFGILIAYGGIKSIARYLPDGTFPGEASFQLSLPVLLFSTTVAVLTGIVFGAWPAIQVSNPRLTQHLPSKGRGLTTGKGARRSHNILIAGQVALTVILLAAAGATVRTLYGLMHAPLGYDPHNVAWITVPLRDGSYTNWQKRVTYYEQTREKVATIPGVISVAIGYTYLPPVSLYRTSAEIRGSSSGESQLVTMQQISPEYFSTLRIALLRGRLWTESETLHGAHLAIINATMAEHYWPHGDPIGQMIRLDELKPRTTWILEAPGNDSWVQVVGVAADTPNNGLREPVSPTVYVPYTLVANDAFDLIVKTQGDPLGFVLPIREQIHRLDGDQMVSEMTTAEQRLDSEGWSRERFVAALFVSFASLGLALGTFGLYSVASYMVSQRTHEFGIRMALGARRADVLRTVLRSSCVVVSAGLSSGLVLSIAGGRVLEHWIEGTVRDPIVLVVVTFVVLLVTTVASLLPAGRAASIDPMEVLRAE